MANKSQYQKFISEEIHRSQLKNAEYNPRIIGKDEAKRLKAGLAEHGLVQPIVWNKKTGNIVGGHQRLAALDALEKTKDYTLDVSVICVDEREEAKINVQLNNPSMQGEWDVDALADLAIGLNIDMSDFGFSNTDVDFMFNGDDRFSELYDPPEVDEEKNKLQEIKDAREMGKERLADRGNINFYTVLVFENEDERAEFHKKIGIPVYEEYISLSQIDRYLEQ